MFEVHPDWTFAKLLEVSLLSVPQSEWLDADSDGPVCELRKEMNAHSAELVQVPLQCCRVNGSFVRYLYPSTSQSTVEKNVIEVLMNASMHHLR